MEREQRRLPDVESMDASSKLPSLKAGSLRDRLQAIGWWVGYITRSMGGGFEEWRVTDPPNLRVLNGSQTRAVNEQEDQTLPSNS